MIERISILMFLLAAASCSRQTPGQHERQTGSTHFQTEGRTVAVYTTAMDSQLRMTPAGTVSFTKLETTSESEIYIFTDPSRTYQSVLGIGGALTDASAETFFSLPDEKQKEILKAYYNPETGIGYTLARTNINSCDFSSGSYTYVDEGDMELRSFNLDHDRKYKIPLIKKAIEAAGGKLTLFASPWSPPAFMKDNNNMLHGGKLKPECFGPWALYYTKFIKGYASEGIPVWAITVQNEPMATQTWESCVYFAGEERDFLQNYLGPVMVKEGLGDVKIIVWDHNRDLIFQRAKAIYDDTEASKYAWGIGFHWYEDWTGGRQMYSNVALVKQVWPEKHLLFTEGTPASFDAERYDDWSLGEAYGISMINDFNAGAEGWTDWNILLDDQGGPNHVGNFCFAPVHALASTGELKYTNSYYYIGHFSKFIKPGDRRILVSPSRSMLLSTGFINSTGKVSVVVMNPSDRKTVYNLCVEDEAAKVESPPHSIQTLVF